MSSTLITGLSISTKNLYRSYLYPPADFLFPLLHHHFPVYFILSIWTQIWFVSKVNHPPVATLFHWFSTPPNLFINYFLKLFSFASLDHSALNTSSIYKTPFVLLSNDATLLNLKRHCQFFTVTHCRNQFLLSKYILHLASMTQWSFQLPEVPSC